MKQTSFALLASASLCFAQGSQPIPMQNRSDQHASASREQSTNPSSFVEPNFLLPENPEVNDYRPVLNADATMVIFERNLTATPNDVKLHIADLATGNVQPFVTSHRPGLIGAGTGLEVALQAARLPSAIMTASTVLILAVSQPRSRTLLV